MNRRSFLTQGLMATAAVPLAPLVGKACCRRRRTAVHYCEPYSPVSEGAVAWKFLVPANHYAIFYFVDDSGSKRYNFFNLIGPGSKNTPIPILKAYPWMHRVLKEKFSVEYTLRAYAQIPMTSSVTASDITAREVMANKEWMITVRGQEGKNILVSLQITT